MVTRNVDENLTFYYKKKRILSVFFAQEEREKKKRNWNVTEHLRFLLFLYLSGIFNECFVRWIAIFIE